MAEAPAAPPAATSRLYSMLEHNERFVRLRSEGYKVVRRDTDQPKPAGASHRACIVTCMDSRLSTLLPEALDLWDGEAKWIKNAGAVITHPFGGELRRPRALRRRSPHRLPGRREPPGRLGPTT